MHVIICGARSRRLTDHEAAWLTRQFRRLGITRVYHGGAPGIDTDAGRLAAEGGIEVCITFADWAIYGAAAGPIRNARQLHLLQEEAGDTPIAVLAFPGNAGTADMVRQTQAAGVRLIVAREAMEKEARMPMNQRQDLLTLCTALHDAGIWLFLTDLGALTVGPVRLVEQHPDLLARVREHKAEITQLLEESLAHGLFGAKDTDERFEREQCPDCLQDCYVVLGPRRLRVHRLPGGKEMCPGSDRAQHHATQVILMAFLNDRCEYRKQSVLSWYSLRGALEGWCAERSFLLPPRPYVLAFLDGLFQRHGRMGDDNPAWQGLTLTLLEWGLNDEPGQPPQATTTPPIREKLVLKA